MTPLKPHTTYKRPDEKHPAIVLGKVCDEQDRWWIHYRFNGRVYRCRPYVFERDYVQAGALIEEAQP